jgi:NAD(P)-dependent dehydrogenase (short-subunit alcohol dehydrogenase family)
MICIWENQPLKKVTVITGAAGGMGLAAAQIMGKEHHVVICDVNKGRLDKAIAELRQLGIGCDSVVCDITDAGSVQALMRQAVALGTLASVGH